MFVTVDEELLRLSIAVCETAIENTAECLAIHDNALGRTTRKNRWIAEQHEKELADAKRCRSKLREVMHWDARGLCDDDGSTGRACPPVPQDAGGPL